MQVKDLTIEEFKLLIQETVAETIQSLLIDPDEGGKSSQRLSSNFSIFYIVLKLESAGFRLRKLPRNWV